MRRILVLAALSGASLAVGFVGCATEGTPESPPVVSPDAESGVDAAIGVDAAEAGRCAADDCTTYPLDCSASTLCSVQAGFDPRAELWGLWASGPSDVWAAGSLGAVVHYDGATWHSVPTGRKETFHSLWGDAPGRVWLASSNDFLLHAQPTTLTTGIWDVFDVYDGTNQACPVAGLWGSASKGVWGTLACLNYSSPFPTPTNAVLHSSAWLSDGGPSWDLEYQSPSIARMTWEVSSVFGFGDDDVWVGGTGGVLFRRAPPAVSDSGDDSPVWLEVNSRAATTINGIGGTSSNDVWLVGDLGLIRHWDGTTMTSLDLPDGIPQASLQGVWATSSNDIWIVGDGALLLHYDGTQFKRIPVGGLAAVIPTFHKVWASDTTQELWVVGDGVLLGGKTGTLR